MKSDKATKANLKELYNELKERDPADDPIVLARRSNNRRIEQLNQLSADISALEGMEKSGKYDVDVIERAARIVAAEHAGLVEDISIEVEALEQALAERRAEQ